MNFAASPRTAARAPSAVLMADSAGPFWALPQDAKSSASTSAPAPRSRVCPIRLAPRMESSPLRRAPALRDAQTLADPDEIGVLQRVLVGLEDLRVERAVAVVLHGDLPQRLALLHLMPLRGVELVGAAAFLVLGDHGVSRARSGPAALAHRLADETP